MNSRFAITAICLFSGTFSYGAWVEVQAVMPSASGYIIHNQGAMGTCYANSMAVVIDAILRNPNLPSSGSSQIAGPGGSGGWISSPLALATNDFVKYYEDKDDKTLNIEREIGYPEILLDSQSTCALGCSASV